MSATILDGRATREALMPGLIKKVQALGSAPILAIVQIGERPDSTAFINAKIAFAKKIAVTEIHLKLAANISQEELISTINALNQKSEIKGIIVQLPLPENIDRDKVINAIDPHKDVDGLTTFNVQALDSGHPNVIPATARGVVELLSYYNIDLRGRIVTVVGRSKLVGQPMAAMCKLAGAIVIVCHSETADLVTETLKADILISATGKPGLITAKHVKAGQIVIDVGITRLPDKGLVGDVDFDGVKDIVGAITPVPGGVGPMTVLTLFENLVDLSK